MTFPKWHQPNPSVGAILVTSQEELDALGNWPDYPNSGPVGEEAPAMTKAQLIEAIEAKGGKVDKTANKAALAEQLAAL